MAHGLRLQGDDPQQHHRDRHAFRPAPDDRLHQQARCVDKGSNLHGLLMHIFVLFFVHIFTFVHEDELNFPLKKVKIN